MIFSPYFLYFSLTKLYVNLNMKKEGSLTYFKKHKYSQESRERGFHFFMNSHETDFSPEESFEYYDVLELQSH